MQIRPLDLHDDQSMRDVYFIECVANQKVRPGWVPLSQDARILGWRADDGWRNHLIGAWESSTVTEVDLQRALFSPPRFKTLGFLVQVEGSDHPSIQEFTGLSLPDVSRAVGFLDENNLVQVRKERTGWYSVTVVRASEEGRAEFHRLLKSLRKYGAGSN